MTKFPSQLKMYRTQQGLSQESLARKVHVTRQAISKWEAGESSPDVTSLVKLANIFNISLDKLVLGQPSSSTSRIDSSKFVFDPIKNRYVRNVHNMNAYEFIAYYWWIILIFLIFFSSVIFRFLNM